MTNHIRFLTSLALTSALLAVATLIGGYLYLKPGLPDVESLRTVKLQTPLQIFTSDGQLIAQFGEKRRDLAGKLLRGAEQAGAQVVDGEIDGLGHLGLAHLQQDEDDRRLLQALVLGQRRQHGLHVLDGVVQIQGNVFQGQLAGLDLGEVEDVIDHAHQLAGAVMNGVRVAAGGLRQFEITQQFAHADDAVERRADLVAHRGQKVGLGLTGGLGAPGTDFQFAAQRLQCLARGLVVSGFLEKHGKHDPTSQTHTEDHHQQQQVQSLQTNALCGIDLGQMAVDGHDQPFGLGG